jgi:hypothetical protein
MDRYFPAPKATALPTLKSAKQDGAKIAGTYETSRRSDSNMLRIASLLGASKMSVNSDGTVSMNDVVNIAGNPKKYREVAPFRWQEVNGPTQLIAVMTDGVVERIYTSNLPPILAITPAPWWRGGWSMPLFVAMLAMLGLTAVFWPIKAILRWRYGSAFALEGREATLYRLARGAALCDIVFLGGFVMLFQYANDHLEVLSDRYDWVFRLLQLFGALGLIGTIAIVWNFIAGLRNPERRWWTKLTDLLLVLAGLAYVWFVFTEKLITLGLNY